MEVREPYKAGIYFCDAVNKGFLNLAIGETPYGMSDASRKVLIEAAEKGSLPYPDSSGGELVEKIASHCRVDPDMVFIGNGTDEILLCCALAFLRAGDACLMCRPTFPGFEASAGLVRATPLYSPLNQMRVDVENMAALLQKWPPLCFLCNPHNPTGTAIRPSDERYLIETASRCNVVTVVDEAYAEYADPSEHEAGREKVDQIPENFCERVPVFESALSLVHQYPNVIVTRTFSKIYGIAGLRCGYAIGNKLLIEQLKKTRHAVPFNVNRLALIVGCAAIQDQNFVRECYRKTEEVKQFFYRWLKEKNLSYVPSFTNFVLVHFNRETDSICAELKDRYQILVRSGTPFGYPHSIRITLGTLDQMKYAVQCLEKVCLKFELSAAPPEAVFFE